MGSIFGINNQQFWMRIAVQRGGNWAKICLTIHCLHVVLISENSPSSNFAHFSKTSLMLWTTWLWCNTGYNKIIRLRLMYSIDLSSYVHISQFMSDCHLGQSIFKLLRHFSHCLSLQINVASCEGKCPSATIYNINVESHLRFCKCCRENGVRNLTVPLYCSGNGTQVLHTLQEPIDCTCQWS